MSGQVVVFTVMVNVCQCWLLGAWDKYGLPGDAVCSGKTMSVIASNMLHKLIPVVFYVTVNAERKTLYNRDALDKKEGYPKTIG